MKKFKKILILLVTACMLFSVSGCILQVNQEKNRNIVVALIDGEYEIKKGDYLDLLSYYIALYAAYGYDVTSDRETLNSLRQSCIDALVEEKIYEIEMDKIGFEINDEDREKAREDFEKEIQDLADQYEEEAKEEQEKAEQEEAEDDENNDESSDEQPDADTEDDNDASENGDADENGETEERDFYQEAYDYYMELLEERGMTEDEYIDEMAKEYRLERWKKYVMVDIEATDEEIEEYYKEQLDAQMLKPDLEADVLIYEPSGVSYKYIKVTLTTEELEEYNKLLDEEDEDAAKKFIEETSYARAQEYLKRLNAGESFEDVMADANKFLVENCGVDEESLDDPEEELKLYKSVGSTGFAGTLDTKLLGAVEGDVTGVLDAEDGVYVIGKCYGRFESVTHEYEVGNEIYDAIKEVLEEEKRDEEWSTRSDEIIAAHKIKVYTSRTRKSY